MKTETKLNYYQSIASQIEYFERAIAALVRENEPNRFGSVYLDGERSKSHAFVPLPTLSFINSMFAVVEAVEKDGRTASEYTFVDFGSGPGIKMVIARAFGFQVMGFEFNEEYVKRSYGLGVSSLIKIKDLEQLDPLEIPSKSILYFYRPFQDGTKQDAFEEKIFTSMSKESYAIPFGGTGLLQSKLQTVSGDWKLGARVYRKEVTELKPKRNGKRAVEC